LFTHLSTRSRAPFTLSVHRSRVALTRSRVALTRSRGPPHRFADWSHFGNWRPGCSVNVLDGAELSARQLAAAAWAGMERDDHGASSRRKAHREAVRAREQTLRAESKGSKSHRERQERRGERSHRQRTRSRSRSRSSSSRSHSRSSESPDGHGRDYRRTKLRSRSTRSPSSSGSESHFQKNPARRRDSFDATRVREAHLEARDAASRARDRPKQDTKFGRKQRSGRAPSASQARSGVKPSTKKRAHSKETVVKASFSLHALERNQRGRLEKFGKKEGLLVEVREPSPASHT
jgi:hypothetical protein